jgi:RNA polymerase sigma factor (sigma-70 family)
MAIFSIFKKSKKSELVTGVETSHEQEREVDSECKVEFSNPTIPTLDFNGILEKYQRKIYWHIRKMVINHDDADDLTQDTFIKVWQNLSTFRADSQIYTWIYRIATNECLTFLEKKKKRNSIDISDFQDILPDLENDPLITGNEIQIKLQKALLTLPDKQRLVFNMKYFDEMKYSEIAAITGTSEGALKASYHLAVKKIEEYLNLD